MRKSGAFSGVWSSRMTVSNRSKVVIALKSTSVMQLPKGSWIHLNLCGCGGNLQATIEQSLVETVAGTKHELVNARPDWIPITIGRGVVD